MNKTKSKTSDKTAGIRVKSAVKAGGFGIGNHNAAVVAALR